MAQSVIVHKEKKVNAIFEKYGYDITPEEFEEFFIKEFPNDWDRVWKRYKEHEKKGNIRKGHPMPHPNQYIRNMYNVRIKKYKQELYLLQKENNSENE